MKSGLKFEVMNSTKYLIVLYICYLIVKNNRRAIPPIKGGCQRE